MLDRKTEISGGTITFKGGEVCVCRCVCVCWLREVDESKYSVAMASALYTDLLYHWMAGLGSSWVA